MKDSTLGVNLLETECISIKYWKRNSDFNVKGVKFKDTTLVIAISKHVNQGATLKLFKRFSKFIVVVYCTGLTNCRKTREEQRQLQKHASMDHVFVVSCDKRGRYIPQQCDSAEGIYFSLMTKFIYFIHCISNKVEWKVESA